ncbi:hypothetical protein BC835DRAFT_1389766 [Cytidiella melzeri]|nr:hypothetical protein BC835DRAFT_1389766 [Cytidiella melzeri]
MHFLTPLLLCAAISAAVFHTVTVAAVPYGTIVNSESRYRRATRPRLPSPEIFGVPPIEARPNVRQKKPKERYRNIHDNRARSKPTPPKALNPANPTNPANPAKPT